MLLLDYLVIFYSQNTTNSTVMLRPTCEKPYFRWSGD